jgi:hypothetical protein
MSLKLKNVLKLRDKSAFFRLSLATTPNSFISKVCKTTNSLKLLVSLSPIFLVNRVHIVKLKKPLPLIFVQVPLFESSSMALLCFIDFRNESLKFSKQGMAV